MKIDETKKYIRYCMCEGRLVGNTKPIIDEKWQAGVMAIASLEAWEKVKAEIEDMLETLSDGGDDWFTAEKLNDVLEIIDKHLQEVADDLCRKEAD